MRLDVWPVRQRLDLAKSFPTSRGRLMTAASRVCRARTERTTSASSQLAWSARVVTAHKARSKLPGVRCKVQE